MNMGEKINNILKGEIISSVFYILLGLCLILIPTQTVDCDLQSSIRADPHRSWHLSYLYLHTWKSESYDHGSSKCVWVVFVAGCVSFYDTVHRDQIASMDAQRICTG